MKLKGFTLIEVMVVIAVFAIISVAAGGLFFSLQRSWERQRMDLDVIQNCRWALEAIISEAREGTNLSQADIPAGVDGFHFELTGGVRVWYWRGGANNDRIFRGQGPDVATAVATRQELADFVVDNANGNAFATIDTGGAAGTCAGDEVACWLFDDGTANDPQNGINGTFMRGAHIVSDPVKGNVVSFSHGTGGPGSGDYVHLPVTPLLEIPVNITISAWVRYSGTFSGAWGARFIYKRCRDVGPDIHVPAGSGILRFAFTRGFPQRYNVDSTQDYNDDQWHHVAATYDGSTASLYVDGNLENSIPATGNIVYTHPHNPPHRGTSIGRNGDEDNRFWGGFIDEVKVWNRPLDAGEIQALSNAGSASFITIELTTQRRGRTHHLRSGVRTRN